MGYTKRVILDRCSQALKNASLFYTEDFINYSGRCSDTDEFYTEIIAEFVLDHLEAFCDGIAVIKRNSSYKVQSHDGAYSLTSRREEENCAKKIFSFCKDGGCYNHIGRIIDYQTPLKATSKDIAGKIDLLAYDGKILRLLELKKPDSEETMLRCILEGFTYLRTVDQEKLLIDFELPLNTIIKASPFVFKGGSQWSEMQEYRPNLFRLMERLDCQPYYITANDEAFDVEDE